jgi:hypothetical protein
VAILVARSNATLVFQLDRLVKEAAFVERRLCYEAKEAEQHLTGALSPTEIERARAFLAEYRSTD